LKSPLINITNIMKIFSNDTELKERLESANMETVELTELVAKRESEIIDLTSNLAAMAELSDAAKVELEESKATAATLTNENTELVAQLKASQEAQVEFDEKVSNAALARMQELGVSEPVASIADDETDDIYTQYTKLKSTDPARAGAFWRANEAEIKASI